MATSVMMCKDVGLMVSQVKIPGPYAAARFTLGRTSSCQILLQFNHYTSS